METSILKSVKKTLGISADDTSFDEDLLIHINAAFATLQQLGVGPVEGFQISSDTAVWTTITTSDPRLNLIQSYIYMKVRSVFDPPSTGYLVESLKNQLQETEWRLTNLVAGAVDE